MGPRLFHILVFLSLSVLLAACSSGPDQEIRLESPCTPAPKKAKNKPYQINGVWYYPQPHFEYEEEGIASYYGGGDIFHGRPTATGERFDMNGTTAAHKTLPIPCVAEVINLENGRQLKVRINDRGPFVEGRIIDVSRRVAQLLGFEGKGTAKVRVRTLVPESLALYDVRFPPVMLAGSASSPKATRPSKAKTYVAEAKGPKLPDSLFDSAETPSRSPLLAAYSPPPAAKTSSLRSTGIFVHIGGYSSQAEIHALLKQLARLTNSQAKPIRSDGPKPYAVRLGPLPSMSHANQILDLLTRAGHLMSRIVIQR